MKPVSKLFEELRARLSDEDQVKALLELEAELREAERSAEGRVKLYEDEIAALKELGGMSPDEASFRLVETQKELKRLKRDNLEAQVALESLQRRNKELREDSERLEQAALKARETAGRAKSRWLWNVELLEKEKDLLRDEIAAAGEKFHGFVKEWAQTASLMRQASSDEKSELETRLFERLYRLLAEHRRSVSEEEGLLARGLMLFIQNQVGGLKGTAQLLRERALHMLPAPGQKLNAALILTLSPKQIQSELEFIHRVLDEKSEAVERLQRGLKDLEALVRTPELSLEHVSISDWLSGWLSEHAEWLKDKRLEIENRANDAGALFADKALLGKALEEVLANCAQAKPDGARVVLRAERSEESGESGFSVSDDGPGVPPHLRDKIFYPFFTTKDNHSGLGLARALRWVSLSGGRLECSDAPAGGARFSFRFPAPRPSGPAS